MTASSADKVYNAKAARLTKLRDSGVTKFLYTYDLGDNFEHRIEISISSRRLQARVCRSFSAVSGANPKEDVRRAAGFEMFLETINHPNHEDYDHLVYS